MLIDYPIYILYNSNEKEVTIMTPYDLYLDNNVTGCIVFKTLSKQKIQDTIQYLYYGKLKINNENLQQNGRCLFIPLNQNFEEILNILATNTTDSQITNHTFHASIRPPVEVFKYYTRIPMILFGTTQTFQTFIIISNIRDSQTVLDFHFQNGQSFYYKKNHVYKLEEKNLFSKYYKKFDLDQISL